MMWEDEVAFQSLHIRVFELANSLGVCVCPEAK